MSLGSVQSHRQTSQETIEESLDIGSSVSKENPLSTDVRCGEFSDVWKGRYAFQNHEISVAIKVLRGAPSYNVELHEQTKRRLKKEARLWLALNHPNILTFYGISYDFSYLPAIILPWVEDGNILEYIKKTNGKTNILQLTELQLRDASCGLVYLHGRNIIHGDLRAANILVSASGIAMLADFRLTFVIDHGEFTTNKVAGSVRWIPPEILNPSLDDASDLPYSTSSDVYSFAMTIVEVCDGMVPYHGVKNDSAVIFQILKGIMETCWKENPDERPVADEVLRAFDQTLKTRDLNFIWLFASFVLNSARVILNGIKRLLRFDLRIDQGVPTQVPAHH